MPIETRFTKLLGIELPIVQAPIGGASTPELVAAVSNAGGLGVLSATWRSLEALDELLRRTKRLTARPFGVNLVLEWDPSERLALSLRHEVKIVSFFWGDPKAWIPICHQAGALVCQTVASAEEAKAACAAGVDVLVAQGWEAGGHVWGEVSTLALTPRVVDVSGSTPVLAAGGIADGRGLASVLALGADGAWIGSRFVAARESAAHPEWQARLIRASETDTVHTELFDVDWPNAPHRTLRNSAYDDWRLAGSPPTGKRPNEDQPVGANEIGEAIPRYGSAAPLVGTTGDLEAMTNYAGQGVGLIADVRPAADIVHEIADDARESLDRAAGLYRQPDRPRVGE